MSSSHNILVIDDDPFICDSFKMFLEDSGYGVITAEDGKKGLDLFKSKNPDLILLDLRMPEITGFEILREVTEQSPDIPVIIISGTGSIEDVIRALKCGAWDYLLKPIENLNVLLHAVEKALERAKLIRENRDYQQYLESEIKGRTSEIEAVNESLTHEIKERRIIEKELRKANQKIVQQQQKTIKDERLKVLLQMAGATAHELNQPLMVLLGNIEMMKKHKKKQTKIYKYVQEIEEAGWRIADIVKKIHSIRHDESRPYLNNRSSIININQNIRILSVNNSDDDFNKLENAVGSQKYIKITRAKKIEEALKFLKIKQFDIIFTDYYLSDGNGHIFLQRIKEEELEKPMVVLTEKGEESSVAQMIQSGAYDYIPKDRINDKSVFRIIETSLEKARLIGELREAYDELEELTIKDKVSGLYNKKYFWEAIEREISRSKRYGNELVLCIFELDYFQGIIDTYGHSIAEMVLSEIGWMMREYVRQSDLVFRFRDDKLAIILPDTGINMGKFVCKRFNEIIENHQFEYTTCKFSITVTMKIGSYREFEGKSSQEFVNAIEQSSLKVNSDTDIIGTQSNEMDQMYVWSKFIEFEKNVKIAGNRINYNSNGNKLGDILISSGYIAQEELDAALFEQKMRFGEMLVKTGQITSQQLDIALFYQKKAPLKIGEIIRGMGYINLEDINRILLKMQRRVGEILIEKGSLKDSELDRALALQHYELGQEVTMSN